MGRPPPARPGHPLGPPPRPIRRRPLEEGEAAGRDRRRSRRLTATSPCSPAPPPSSASASAPSTAAASSPASSTPSGSSRCLGSSSSPCPPSMPAAPGDEGRLGRARSRLVAEGDRTRFALDGALYTAAGTSRHHRARGSPGPSLPPPRPGPRPRDTLTPGCASAMPEPATSVASEPITRTPTCSCPRRACIAWPNGMGPCLGRGGRPHRRRGDGRVLPAHRPRRGCHLALQARPRPQL